MAWVQMQVVPWLWKTCAGCFVDVQDGRHSVTGSTCVRTGLGAAEMVVTVRTARPSRAMLVYVFE
jgi:hypothetical protein